MSLFKHGEAHSSVAPQRHHPAGGERCTLRENSHEVIHFYHMVLCSGDQRDAFRDSSCCVDQRVLGLFLQMLWFFSWYLEHFSQLQLRLSLCSRVSPEFACEARLRLCWSSGLSFLSAGRWPVVNSSFRRLYVNVHFKCYQRTLKEYLYTHCWGKSCTYMFLIIIFYSHVTWPLYVESF